MIAVPRPSRFLRGVAHHCAFLLASRAFERRVQIQNLRRTQHRPRRCRKCWSSQATPDDSSIRAHARRAASSKTSFTTPNTSGWMPSWRIAVICASRWCRRGSTAARLPAPRACQRCGCGGRAAGNPPPCVEYLTYLEKLDEERQVAKRHDARRRSLSTWIRPPERIERNRSILSYPAVRVTSSIGELLRTKTCAANPLPPRPYRCDTVLQLPFIG